MAHKFELTQTELKAYVDLSTSDTVSSSMLDNPAWELGISLRGNDRISYYNL